MFSNVVYMENVLLDLYFVNCCISYIVLTFLDLEIWKLPSPRL